ncbi:hypothetical protein EPD60_00185 [Flaviaesturariibacter flavus]|uniref:Pectate lyase superfamily protein domain-containing protein n=1 Tax=Flaviaesturariibacter flavus TaxID=2502780 RepID=A0A4R1BQL0_9BACT|nr:hypothetical protein [Flaviaesturariibacter flavus]TCJ19577.1 hypothetical protein EPD60_00185 [Flaviaesturariibacter flavus]
MNPVQLRSAVAVALLTTLTQLSSAQDLPVAAAATVSEWVTAAPDGKLTYKTLPAGDRILDFSYAGYRGGGVALPNVPVVLTLGPGDGDQSAAIQDALNELARRPLRNGFRGALLLAPGNYPCEKTILIPASGIVLRGSGSGTSGTVLTMVGKEHVCISVSGKVSMRPVGAPVRIANAYVPSGSISLQVADARTFVAGDTVRIARPVTERWVHFMGMDSMVRDGKPQTWITGEISVDRVITKVAGSRITVDVPLTDSYDERYLGPTGATVVKITGSGELSEVGIERLRIVSPAQSVTISEGHHRAITMGGIADGWLRDIEVFNTVNSVSITGRRITVQGLHIAHELATKGAAKPADINGSGQQLLFDRCRIEGDNLFFFGTGAKASGPVVLLNCTFRGNGWIQPHQRWATGLLVDNCTVPEGGIDFMNRGSMGSGHGWAIGWAVAWNCTARSFLNQQPPGAANWVIGSSGERQHKAIPFLEQPILPEGIYDAHGKRVSPSSLYLAQLQARLGRQAVVNTGYETSTRK